MAHSQVFEVGNSFPSPLLRVWDHILSLLQHSLLKDGAEVRIL